MLYDSLKEQALQRLWELFQDGEDWTGNAVQVLDSYTADVLSGRADAYRDRAHQEDRRMALERDDSRVSPYVVRCAGEGCGNRVERDGERHPWDVAISQGWTRTDSRTDLICPNPTP